MLSVGEVRRGGVDVALVEATATCRSASPGIACTVSARYEVVAVGSEAAEVVLRTNTWTTVREVDGRAVSWEESREATRRFRIRPRQTVVVVLGGDVRERGGAGPFYGAGCFLDPHGGCPGMYARHAFVGRATSPRPADSTLWLPSLDSERLSAATITIRHPSRWRVSSFSPDVGVERAADGRSTRLTLPAGFEGDAAKLERGRRVRRDRGGPFLGLGRVRRQGPFLRVGYEHPLAVLGDDFGVSLSGTVESNVVDQLGVAVVGSFILPTASILPSLSLGLGVPVQCAPQPAGGVRLEMSLHARLLGVEVMVDRYPRLDEWRWAWVLRASL